MTSGLVSLCVCAPPFPPGAVVDGARRGRGMSSTTRSAQVPAGTGRCGTSNGSTTAAVVDWAASGSASTARRRTSWAGPAPAPVPAPRRLRERGRLRRERAGRSGGRRVPSGPCPAHAAAARGSRGAWQGARPRADPGCVRATRPGAGGRAAARSPRRVDRRSMPMPSSVIVITKRRSSSAAGDDDRRRRRRERSGVLEELGEQVGHVGDRVPRHRDRLVEPEVADPREVRDLRGRAARHVEHGHGCPPLTRLLGTGEHEQALGVAAHAGREMVELEERRRARRDPRHGASISSSRRDLAVEQALVAASEVDVQVADALAQQLGLLARRPRRSPAARC